MADVKTVDEGGELPEKRKLDHPKSVKEAPEDEKDRDDSIKRRKIEVPASKNGTFTPSDGGSTTNLDEHLNVAADAEDDDDDEEDYNADEDFNGEPENVDSKGKGVMVDRKGKGKMIEDSEDDDSDGNEDDGGNDDDSSDDSDSDFSDGLDGSDPEEDPLAGVDLDNILPSRTRRSRSQPGVRISDDNYKASAWTKYTNN